VELAPVELAPVELAPVELAPVGLVPEDFVAADFSPAGGLAGDFAPGAADFAAPLAPAGAFCWAATGEIREGEIRHPNEIASGATERPQRATNKRDEAGSFCMVASILAW
jgi:hypothetical protein